jgi:hypothetical protein
MSGGDDEHGLTDPSWAAGDAVLGAMADASPTARAKDLIRRAGVDADAKEWLHGGTDHDRLDLDEHNRLPWLESGDDDEEYVGIDTRRVIAAVMGGLALLAAIVGGIWFMTHRADQGTPLADGSTIAAPAAPFKETPKDPGGKTFDGTGDSSFAVSQGQNRPAHLAANETGNDAGNAAGSGAEQAGASAAAAASSASAAVGASFAGGATAAKPAPAVAVAKPTADQADAGGTAGGVVQIAAYSNHALAEAGWNRLVVAHDMLKGMNHRIVSAQIDMGTVYRLQLVTGAGGGSALCDKLRGDGLPCQVKR